MMNGEKYVSLESGDQWQASLKIRIQRSLRR